VKHGNNEEIMSSQKPLIKTEKAKQLREMRRRLEWTQQQMAEALGLDPSYLSQLENGRRKLDDWYLKKASEFEKSKSGGIITSGPADSYSLESTAESCLAYLRQFLTSCKDPAKIVWTYVELQEHFPLDKWAETAEDLSSKATFASTITAPKPVVTLDRDRPKP
jgi:DNA-binding XRE family transcriptional regulator